MRPQKSTATIGTVGAVAIVPAMAAVDTSDYVGKHRPPRFSLHRGVRVSQLSERAEPAPSQ